MLAISMKNTLTSTGLRLKRDTTLLLLSFIREFFKYVLTCPSAIHVRQPYMSVLMSVLGSALNETRHSLVMLT